MIFLLLTTRARELLLLFMLAASFTLSAQEQAARPTRQSSLEAYSRADYQSAYRQFAELLNLYPADPLYKYYTGVCLVRLEKDPSVAIKLLTEAQGTAGQLRTVPSDITFWLGRALQQAGMYTDAIAAFNQFTLQSGRKSAKDYDVSRFIEQSTAQLGSVIDTIDEPDLPAEEPLLPAEEKTFVKTDTLPAEIDSRLGKVLNAVSSGNSSQDKLLAELGELSKELSEGSDSLSLDAEVKSLEPEDIEISDITEVNKIANMVRREEPVQEPKAEYTVHPSQNPVEVFKQFKIDSRRVYNSDEKISIDGSIPRGLVYRLQVAVFRNPVAPSYFKGMEPVVGFTLAGKGLTIYYAGLFRSMAEASRALAEAKKLGFKDAFVASLMDGKSVSADRAAILEKEWGSIPLFTQQPSVIAAADTLPPALSFRVELARSDKALKEDIVEGMRRITGARGFDLVILPDGVHVYLAGTFITYDSAEEYSDLLVRNGYRDARVSAWLGNKEIAVETARALFENVD